MAATSIKSDSQLRNKILRILDEEIRSNPVSYNKEQPYQSYERIGFEGLRWSVEKRIQEYGLEEFFDPESAILDIGSNFGFFVCEFALHCRLVHGVEPNPHLNRIGEITAEYLGVGDHVKFFDCPFEDFDSSQRYDTVFSLAAFHTQDGRERGNARDYFGKVAKILKPGGRIYYESTSYTKSPGKESYQGFLAKTKALEVLGVEMKLLREWETPSGSEDYFRQFALACKE